MDEHVSKGAGDHMRSMMKSLRALKKSQDENTVSIRKLNETGYGGDKASIFESPWNGRDGNILKAEVSVVALFLSSLKFPNVLISDRDKDFVFILQVSLIIKSLEIPKLIEFPLFEHLINMKNFPEIIP